MKALMMNSRSEFCLLNADRRETNRTGSVKVRWAIDRGLSSNDLLARWRRLACFHYAVMNSVAPCYVIYRPSDASSMRLQGNFGFIYPLSTLSLDARCLFFFSVSSHAEKPEVRPCDFFRWTFIIGPTGYRSTRGCVFHRVWTLPWQRKPFAPIVVLAEKTSRLLDALRSPCAISS